MKRFRPPQLNCSLLFPHHLRPQLPFLSRLSTSTLIESKRNEKIDSGLVLDRVRFSRLFQCSIVDENRTLQAERRSLH